MWLIGQPHQPEGAGRSHDGPASPAASESRHSAADETGGSAAPGEDPARWLTIRSFPTAQQCVAALREERRTLWCTDLSQTAETLDAALAAGGVASAHAPGTCSLTPDGLKTDHGETPPRRLAVAFSGSEGEGVSREMLDAADKRVFLPLHGRRHPLRSVKSHVLLSCMQQDFPSGGSYPCLAQCTHALNTHARQSQSLVLL